MKAKLGDTVTYEDFLARVEKYHAQFKDSWKYGQTYVNVLSSVKPGLVEQLRGTLHDPSRKDDVPGETHKFVKSIW